MSRFCSRAAPGARGGRPRIGRRAAQLLVGSGCDVIVSDDGLQHYALARDCEIVVIDGDRRFGNGWLLPAGPLRETRSRLAVADAIVVNGGRAMLEGALSMRLEAKSAVALATGRVSPLDAFAGLKCTRSPASAIPSASSTCCARMASRSWVTRSRTTSA